MLNVNGNKYSPHKHELSDYCRDCFTPIEDSLKHVDDVDTWRDFSRCFARNLTQNELTDIELANAEKKSDSLTGK